MKKNLESIHASSLRLLEPVSLINTYKVIVKEAQKLVGGKIGTILLEQNGALNRVYSSSKILYNITPRKKGYMYQVYKDRIPKVLSVKQISRIHPEIDKAKIRSDIIIPLSYRNHQLGVLTVLSDKNKNFSQNDLSLLKLFGPLASLAIIKSQFYQQLEEAIKTRDLFTSLASHELKTPLTTLSVYTQLVRKRINSNDKINPEWISLIDDQTKWINVLFNELLHFRKVKSGNLVYNLKSRNINELIKRSVLHFQAQFPELKIVVKNQLTSNNFIYADFDMLLQVFTNILNNAGKFSFKKSPVNFMISLENGIYKFEITNIGVKINKTDLPNLYKDFYKGHNHTKKGLGLGLFLAKNIIGKHKGNIKISSENGKTSVIMRIPKKND